LSPIGYVLNKVPILPAVRGAQEAKKELDDLVYELITHTRREQQDSAHNNP
jgi:hypothetical protein